MRESTLQTWKLILLIVACASFSCKQDEQSNLSKERLGADALGGPISVKCLNTEMAEQLASPLPLCDQPDFTRTDAVVSISNVDPNGDVDLRAYHQKLSSLVKVPKNENDEFYKATCESISSGDSQALKLALAMIVDASSRVTATRSNFSRVCPEAIAAIKDLDSFRFLRDQNNPQKIFDDDGSIKTSNVLAATLSLFVHLGNAPRIMAQWFRHGQHHGSLDAVDAANRLWTGARSGIVKAEIWDPDGLLKGGLGVSPDRIKDFVEKRVPKPVQYTAGAVYLVFQKRISQSFRIGKDKEWMAQIRANFNDGFSIYFGASKTFD